MQQRDLGQMVFQRPRPDLVHLAITARQEGDRWGALVMQMRPDAAGVWRVTELVRAQDLDLTVPEPAPRSTAPADPDLPVARSSQTHADARAARRVASQRHTDALREPALAAPEKPAAELRFGDLFRLPDVAQPRWIEVRNAAVDDRIGDVDVQAADGSTVRVPAERPVSVLAVRGGNVERPRPQPPRRPTSWPLLRRSWPSGAGR